MGKKDARQAASKHLAFQPELVSEQAGLCAPPARVGPCVKLSKTL